MTGTKLPKNQVSHSGRRNRSSSWQLRLRKSDLWWNKATQIIEQLSHTVFICCIPANHNHEPLFTGVTLDTNLICIDKFLVVIQNLGSPNQHSICLMHQNDSTVLGKLSYSCPDCISQRPYIMCPLGFCSLFTTDSQSLWVISILNWLQSHNSVHCSLMLDM